MGVSKLLDLCYRRIVQNCFECADIATPLCEHVCQLEDGNLAKVYYDNIENLLKNIMNLKLPINCRLNLAMQLVRFEHNYRDWALKLPSILKNKTNENITYCIHKIVIKKDFKNVDKSKTIIRILQESYFDIELELHEFPKYFNITAKFITKLNALNEKHKHKNPKYARYTRQITNMDTVSYWRLQMLDTWLENGLSISVQAFVFTVLEANADILPSLYKKLKLNSYKQYALSLAIATIIQSQKQPVVQIVPKIMFIYQKMIPKLWAIVLKRFHEEILYHCFLSEHRALCITFFNQLYEMQEIDICKTILCKAVRWIRLLDPNTERCYNYSEIIFLYNRETYQKLWANAEITLKAEMCTDLYELLEDIKYDTELVSILINDTAYSVVKKEDLITHFVTTLVLADRENDLCTFLKDFHMFPIEDIKIKMFMMLKDTIFLQNSDYNYKAVVAFLIKDKLAETELRNQILGQKQSIINIFGTISQGKNGLEALKNFTEWLFADESSKKQFVDEKLLTELWFVDVYKRHLECTYQMLYPNTNLFEYFNVSVKDRKAIKRIIRNDKSFILPLCEQYVIKLPEASRFIECLFEEDEGAERREFELAFLSSPQALNLIYKIFQSDFYDEDMYISNGLFNKVKQIFRFKEHWLTKSNLIEKMKKIIRKNSHPNALPDAEREIRVLLPFEKIEENRLIVDANYRLFRCITFDNVSFTESEFMNYMKESCKAERLTNFTTDCALRVLIEVPIIT